MASKEDRQLQRVQIAAGIFEAIDAAWWDAIEIPLSEHVEFRAITSRIAQVPVRDESDPGWAGKGFTIPAPLDD